MPNIKKIFISILMILTISFNVYATSNDTDDTDDIVTEQTTTNQNSVRDSLNLIGIIFVSIGVIGIGSVVTWSVLSVKKHKKLHPQNQTQTQNKTTANNNAPKNQNGPQNTMIPYDDFDEFSPKIDIFETETEKPQTQHITRSAESDFSSELNPAKNGDLFEKTVVQTQIGNTVVFSGKQLSEEAFKKKPQTRTTNNAKKFDTQEILKEALGDDYL